MMSEPADVAVAEQDGVLVLSVAGDLDAQAREPLLEGYQQASVRTKAREVLLDLGRCAYINSSGIALVVGLLALCRADGRQLSAARRDSRTTGGCSTSPGLAITCTCCRKEDEEKTA